MTKYFVHILGAYMHIHTKYKVSILNPVARRAVHRHQQCQSVADLHTKVSSTRPPNRTKLFCFYICFHFKMPVLEVGAPSNEGWHPPPPMGNPGSAPTNDNYAQQTNHDYIGSFCRIPNEPNISDF